MTSKQLRKIVRECIRETIAEQRLLREWISGTLEDYEIEFETLVIPGISTPTDYVVITVALDYEANPGSPARGMSGPPDRSSPAEGAEVNLTDWDFMSVTVRPEQGEPKVIDDFKTVTREQFNVMKKAVNEYISLNKSKIEEQILDKLGDISDEDGFHPGEDY